MFALFNTLLSAILNVDADQSYYAQLVARLARNRPDTIVTDKPGVVIVQIDGLAQPILAHQIRAGRVPFLARWIRSGEMKLDRWTALLPSQTSASQAGILHGNNSFIPAFRWWEKDGQRMLVSNHPADAAEIVRRASNGEGLLSNDGASVGNLVTGDAVRAYLTMASIDQPATGPGPEPCLVLVLRQPGQLPARPRPVDRRGASRSTSRRRARIGAGSSRRCTAAGRIRSPGPRPTSACAPCRPRW